MAHFKRKKHRSGVSKKCSICAGQRRLFGEQEKVKKKLKVMDKELREIIKSFE